MKILNGKNIIYKKISEKICQLCDIQSEFVKEFEEFDTENKCKEKIRKINEEWLITMDNIISLLREWKKEDESKNIQ